MRPSATPLITLLAVAAFPICASAQLIVRAEAAAGFAHSIGTFRQSYGTGLGVTGGIQVSAENSKFSLRLRGSWQRAKADTTTFPGGGKLNAFGAGADVIFEPHAGDYAPVAPYFFAGGAAYRLRTSASTILGEPPTGSITNTRYGINGGAGLLLAFADDFHFFAEARFQQMFAGSAIATGYGGALPAINLMLGFRWRL